MARLSCKCSAVHVHCSGFLGNRTLRYSLRRQSFELFTQETKLWSNLPGDRPLRQYDSFSGRMFLKKLCVSDTGEDSALHINCSGLRETRALSSSARRQSFKPFSWETEFWVNTIVLVGRWSWTGHSLVTLGKPCFCTFIVQVSGRWSFEPFSQEPELLLSTLVLVGRWSWKGHVSMTLGKS